MGVLAFLALFAGLIQVPGVDEVVTNFLDPVFADSPLAAIAPSIGAAWFGLAIGAAISLAGIGIAYWLYIASPETPATPDQQRFGPVHTFLVQQVVLRRGDRHPRSSARRWRSAASPTTSSSASSSTAWSRGTEETVRGAGGVVRAVQNGFVRSYALLPDRRLRRPRPLLPDLSSS